MAKLETPGVILVQANIVEGQLAIVIRDNGPEAYNAEKHQANSRGVGLKNTEERLRALYGKHYSFNLSANAPTGCIVELKIPWQPAE